MKPRCLIIDDELSIRTVLEDTMQDEGYDVRTAETPGPSKEGYI